MIRRPPRSTQGVSSAASDVYKRQRRARPFPPARHATHTGRRLMIIPCGGSRKLHKLTCRGQSEESTGMSNPGLHWLQAWPLFSSEPTSQHASFHSPKQHPTGWSPPQCQSISCGAERQHEAHASALGSPSQAAEQGVPRTAGTFPKAWCALGFVALAVGRYLSCFSP